VTILLGLSQWLDGALSDIVLEGDLKDHGLLAARVVDSCGIGRIGASSARCWSRWCGAIATSPRWMSSRRRRAERAHRHHAQ
jgi:hypothetical protein